MEFKRRNPSKTSPDLVRLIVKNNKSKHELENVKGLNNSLPESTYTRFCYTCPVYILNKPIMY